jgi:quinol monooxygenase YgiN/uncharacterized protein YndB with AHSA1/START domain
MPIHMTARFRVRQESVETCRDAITRFVAAVQDQEPGTDLYASFQETEDPTSFLHVFRFRDDEAQKAHRTSAAVEQFTATLYPQTDGGVQFTGYSLVATNRDLGAAGFDILHRTTIKAPSSAVYQALTVGEQLGLWWTEDCDAEPQVGSVAHFRFNRGAVTFAMRIDELDRDRRVVWHCLGEHPEWRGTTVTFELSPAAAGTELTFGHRGWRSTQGIFPLCSFDWARYLLSLRALLETGTGTPHAR